MVEPTERDSQESSPAGGRVLAGCGGVLLIGVGCFFATVGLVGYGMAGAGGWEPTVGDNIFFGVVELGSLLAVVKGFRLLRWRPRPPEDPNGGADRPSHH